MLPEVCLVEPLPLVAAVAEDSLAAPLLQHQHLEQQVHVTAWLITMKETVHLIVGIDVERKKNGYVGLKIIYADIGLAESQIKFSMLKLYGGQCVLNLAVSLKFGQCCLYAGHGCI